MDRPTRTSRQIEQLARFHRFQRAQEHQTAGRYHMAAIAYDRAGALKSAAVMRARALEA